MKTQIKIWLVATGALIAFGFAFCNSSAASAESPFDQAIITTDLLVLKNSNNTQLDITNDLAGSLLTCSEEAHDDFYGYLSTAETPRYSIVRVDQANSQFQSSVIITWADPVRTEVNDQDLVWIQNGVNDKPSVVSVGNHGVIINLASNGNLDCNYYNKGESGYTYDYISTEQQDLIPGTINNVYRVYQSTYNANYPDGYSGPEIPQSYEPESAFIPNFTWTVDTSGILRVVYQKNAEINLNGYGNYRLWKTDSSWNIVDGEALDQKVERPFWSYSYEYDRLPEPGYYVVNVTYEEGEWEVAPPGFDSVHGVTFQIYWDGSSFIQGANDSSCSVDPNAGASCNNLSGQNPILSLFKSMTIDTHGLQQLIAAPINFIASLPSYVGNCSPITLPLLGTTQTLPCLSTFYKTGWMAPIWVIWQTVVTAVIGYYVALRLLAAIKNINNPHDDRIEVAKL